MNMNFQGVVALVTAAALTAAGGELVVAPGGLSPQGALEKIRAAKAQGDASAWTVRVKPGRYALAKTLAFTPADSGTPKAPVTWIGEDGAEFAGGAAITGWQDQGNGVWAAPVPKTPDGKPAYFEQLWVNGRRAERARLPNAGRYLHVTAPKIEQAKDVKGRFVETVTITNAAEKAALAALAPDELATAQMCVVHKWSFARRVLRGVDAQTGTVTTWSNENWPGWKRWNEKETLVSFENVRAAFDAPGEWFYDAKAGTVLYRPLSGEDMAKVEIVAPSARLNPLVSFNGDPDKGAFVHDIAFRNIAFAYSAAPGGKNGPSECRNLQAAHGSGGTISLTGARRTAFENCAVRHTGNYALQFNNGCTSNRVTKCTLEDLGAGGVWMGSDSGYVAKGESLSRRVIRNLAPRSVAFNVIEDCTIRTGGRFNPEGTGVAITHASDCAVRHCDIYDFYYTGVSVGWTWGFRGSVAQRNEVAFNRIYDLGKGVMSDMGGVYTLGTSFGTKVHDNVIHDVKSFAYGGWALYTDEGSEGLVMERNVCWNTTDAGFHQHYGTGCVIRNNIFAWNRMVGAVRMVRPEVQGVPCTLHFVNNIVLVREGPLTSAGVCNVGGIWANNLWWDVSGKPKFVGEKYDWAGWAACGKETGGVYADPQFENAAAYDFRLKPTSPALTLGFKPWDMTAAGPRK